MINIPRSKVLLSAFILSMFAVQNSSVQAMWEPEDERPAGKEALSKAANKKQDEEKKLAWDPVKSMTPALNETINVSSVDPMKNLIGKAGPSPSNQALVVMPTEKGNFVLMCRDFDERLTQDGKLRPTNGALKASFGFGLQKHHNFENSYDALVKGPANAALYDMFSRLDQKTIKTACFVYSEGGEGWGSAVTIPVFLSGENDTRMAFDMAQKIIAKLNASATEAYKTRKTGDTVSGRFRDFMLIPLEDLLKTGSDQPAVLDESKLEVIIVDGKQTKLWDESQMRKNLLPLIADFISKLDK